MYVDPDHNPVYFLHVFPFWSLSTILRTCRSNLQRNVTDVLHYIHASVETGILESVCYVKLVFWACIQANLSLDEQYLYAQTNI